jgi:sugar/nucleoside kinase (ribokinase family)
MQAVLRGSLFLLFLLPMANSLNQKSITGIGNALVDILIRLEDDRLLDIFGLPKGSMTLVDEHLSRLMLERTAGLKHTMETGGSAANTIRAVACLNGKTGFIGKICDDAEGRFFRSEFGRLSVSSHLLYSPTATGKAVALISPDSERTFGTYLGAASEMTADELTPAVFEGFDYLHIEGYLIFNHRLIEGVLKLAKNAGLQISLDLASFNVVEANLDFLKKLIGEYVDIVFANEEEARAYTGLNPVDAVRHISQQCKIAVVKIGREGSLIYSGETFTKVGTPQVYSVDTTGAGDVYAAGFLYGLANDFSLQNCGRLGSLLASKVIQVLGARIPDENWAEILMEVERLREKA